jgi:hypothetical protein
VVRHFRGRRATHDGGAEPSCDARRLEVGDGRANVRIEGRRYHVDLLRVEGAALERSLTENFKHKYAVASEHPEEVWFFRLYPAPSADVQVLR